MSGDQHDQVPTGQTVGTPPGRDEPAAGDRAAQHPALNDRLPDPDGADAPGPGQPGQLAEPLDAPLDEGAATGPSDEAAAWSSADRPPVDPVDEPPVQPLPDASDAARLAQPGTAGGPGPVGSGGQAELDLGVAPTGHPGVDAALSRLEELAALPVEEHPAVYDDIHTTVHASLTELAAE